MPKSISAALQADIQANVTTLVMIVQIKRDDGATYRMTNHSRDLTVGDELYDHTIPFLISANSSGSTLSVDNTELTLTLDGVTFTRNDFVNGAFKHAEVLISLVDYENPEDGKMIARTGWFGEIILNTQDIAKISVSGLLKLLDFEVGRVYTPTCDTDLGSRRCGVAIDDAQAYDHENPANVGKWVKVYDKTVMTSAGLVNGDFASDGLRTSSDPITGWTRGPDCGFQVWTGVSTPSTPPSLPPPDSSYYLLGAYDTDNNTTVSSGAIRYVFQDIDTVTAGMNTTDLDNNELQVYLDSYCQSIFYILDPFKLQMDFLDADDNVLSSVDTGWANTFEPDDWDKFFLSSRVPSGCRTIRIFIIMRLNDGVQFNSAISGMDLNFWNHTSVDPTDGVIYKCTRIIQYSENNQSLPANPIFEDNGGVVANTNSANAITSWVIPTTNDYWQVQSTFMGYIPTVGTYMLVGGDDSSAVQKTYEIESTFDVAAGGLDTARIDLGKYIGRLNYDQGHADAVSAGGLEIEFQDSGNSLISLHAVTPVTAAVGWYVGSEDFVIPVTTRYIVLRLQVTSPVGASAANIMFDNFSYFFFDAERPAKLEPIFADGTSGSTFSSTVGVFNLDGNVIWKTVGAHDQTDIVATVTDKKLFTGTTINGADGTYESAVIEWLTGDNVGMKNIIRTWNSSTKAVKLYYQTVNDIQVGDSYKYILPCQKRFLEDCVLTFDNAINFQAFPYLPSKLT